ncbi:MAG: outer membrane protein assembly factor BamE [Pseudomonadota bacterium]
MREVVQKLGQQARLIGLLACTVAVTGCTQMDRYHGFIPPQEELDTLAIGSTTKDEVISLFGPPVSERALENNTLYYGASQFRYFGPFAPEEVDREVLAIDFDSADRLRNITRYTLKDGRVVVLDRRVTEDGINDVTFLGQLLGSFGRIDAGSLFGDDPGGGI